MIFLSVGAKAAESNRRLPSGSQVGKFTEAQDLVPLDISLHVTSLASVISTTWGEYDASTSVTSYG